MDIGKYKQWTILDWEEQFRMEEANICAYFEEIPKYVDLPDEDELIISKLKERKLLLEDSALLESVSDFDFEEEFLEEELNAGKSSSLYYEIGKITESFCDFLACSDNFDRFCGLGILYAAGRMISIHLNIVQLDDNEFPELKRALLKRQFFLLNKIIGFLEGEKLRIGRLSEQVEDFIVKFHGIREKFVDLKFK